MDRHASRERWSLDDALAPSIPLLATPDGAYRLAFEKESAEGRLRISYSRASRNPRSEQRVGSSSSMTRITFQSGIASSRSPCLTGSTSS